MDHPVNTRAALPFQLSHLADSYHCKPAFFKNLQSLSGTLNESLTQASGFMALYDYRLSVSICLSGYA
jgi:hypothetical protein